MNSRRPIQTQLITHKQRHRPTLKQIIMSSTIITRLISRTRRTRQIRSQSRRSIRRRNHHHPRIRNQRRSSHRRTRTRRTNHPHHIRIRHNRLRSRLTPISRTQIIQPRTNRNLTARHRPIIRHRQLHPPLIRQTQKRHITRNRIQRPDLNHLTRTNLNRTQLTRREVGDHRNGRSETEDYVGFACFDVPGVGVVHHCYQLRTAIPERITGNLADDSVEAGLVQLVSEARPVDIHTPAGLHRHPINSPQQHRSRVIRMRPERRRRRLTILILISRQEITRRLTRNTVPIRPIPQIRTRHIHPLRLRQLHKIIRQQTIRRDKRHPLQPRHTPNLLNNKTTLRHKNREKHSLRTTRRHLRQHRRHIRIPLINRRKHRHHPTQLLKSIPKRLRQTLRIRIPIMNSRRPIQTQLITHKQRHRPTLKQIIMSSTIITRLISRTRRTRQIRSQSRRSIRRRNHHHPRIRNQRRSSHRRTRTRRTNHPHHIRIRHNRLRSRLTPISRTQIIQPRTNRNLTARHRPIIRHRQLHPPLIRQTQKRHITRNRIQRPDLNHLTRTNLNRTQLTRRKLLHLRGRDRGGRSRLGGRRGGRALGRRLVRPVAAAGCRSKHQRQSQSCQPSHTSSLQQPGPTSGAGEAPDRRPSGPMITHRPFPLIICHSSGPADQESAVDLNPGEQRAGSENNYHYQIFGIEKPVKNI